jgi:hypothetical protein
MYTLIRLLPFKRLALEQVPTFASAWLIAESFYKFHSFTLEAAAFLATWFAFDVLIQLLRRFVVKPGNAAADVVGQG